VVVIGGDTTRGPLALSVTALGWVDREQALRRSGARPGDLICVSGTLGDAGLALRLSDGRSIAGVSPELRARLERPQPRLALGLALRSLAHCAIDVSDGLAADLGHLLAASGVGATVELARLPCTPVVRQYLADTGDWGLLLGAGDDYELCFTMPAERREELAAVERSSGCAIAVVGAITGETGMRFVAADGGEYRLSRCGYDHFSGMELA